MLVGIFLFKEIIILRFNIILRFKFKVMMNEEIVIYFINYYKRIYYFK